MRLGDSETTNRQWVKRVVSPQYAERFRDTHLHSLRIRYWISVGECVWTIGAFVVICSFQFHYRINITIIEYVFRIQYAVFVCSTTQCICVHSLKVIGLNRLAVRFIDRIKLTTGCVPCGENNNSNKYNPFIGVESRRIETNFDHMMAYATLKWIRTIGSLNNSDK